MMKKILVMLLFAACATSLFAQSRFVASPNVDVQGNNVWMQGTALSENHNYACGKDAFSDVPAIWNIATDEIVRIYEINDEVPYNGCLNDINDNGVAVGNLGSNAIMVQPNGTYVTLYSDSNDDGSAAWGITADGQTIVGLHFDVNWQTHACIWTNNGQTRVDLPAPSADEFGFPIDYVAARWISADGSVILGYAQEGETSSWVALAWQLNTTTGQYVPVCFAADYFANDDQYGDGIYYTFEPTGLSKDGNYAVLKVVESYDPNDWSIMPIDQTARYDLRLGRLEVLNETGEYVEMSAYGIANDGTCVGRAITEAQEMDAFVWEANATSAYTAAESYENDSYLEDKLRIAFSSITSNASYILGYAINNSGQMESFIVDHQASPVGIDDVEGEHVAEPRIKGIFDITGRKLDRVPQHGIYIIDGKKVIR